MYWKILHIIFLLHSKKTYVHTRKSRKSTTSLFVWRMQFHYILLCAVTIHRITLCLSYVVVHSNCEISSSHGKCNIKGDEEQTTCAKFIHKYMYEYEFKHTYIFHFTILFIYFSIPEVSVYDMFQFFFYFFIFIFHVFFVESYARWYLRCTIRQMQEVSNNHFRRAHF